MDNGSELLDKILWGIAILLFGVEIVLISFHVLRSILEVIAK